MATQRKRIVRYTDKQLEAMRAAKVAVPDGCDPDDAIDRLDIRQATTERPPPLRRPRPRSTR